MCYRTNFTLTVHAAPHPLVVEAGATCDAATVLQPAASGVLVAGGSTLQLTPATPPLPPYAQWHAGELALLPPPAAAGAVFFVGVADAATGAA